MPAAKLTLGGVGAGYLAEKLGAAMVDAPPRLLCFSPQFMQWRIIEPNASLGTQHIGGKLALDSNERSGLDEES